MSIYFSGTITRSSGISSAIYKQIKLVNLKPIKKIEVQLDPFHSRALVAREFLYHIQIPSVLDTNLNCIIKPNIVNDRSEPEIRIHLVDSGKIKFLLNNLSLLEVLQCINKHISSKVPVDDTNEIQLAVKSKKTKGKSGKR